jgi:hypothetical protein
MKLTDWSREKHRVDGNSSVRQVSRSLLNTYSVVSRQHFSNSQTMTALCVSKRFVKTTVCFDGVSS